VPRINEAFQNLQSSYLFAEVKRRTQAYRDAHPGVRLTDLGIGDVTLPLPPAVIQALEEATREQARPETLRGYGPYVGYEFLRAAMPRTTSALAASRSPPTRSSSATAARATPRTSRSCSRRTPWWR
jgi:aspartate/methionine/tyrosine aminotransferase